MRGDRVFRVYGSRCYINNPLFRVHGGRNYGNKLLHPVNEIIPQ